MNIRTIAPEDAGNFLSLRNKLDTETPFLLLEPGERLMTAAQQRDKIEYVLSKPNSTILVAELSSQLVGYISLTGGPYQRNKHVGHIVISVLQDYSGRGIGTKLFVELESWAHGVGIHRLELCTMTHNAPAIALYKKMGYKIEGEKRDSLRVNGNYVHEYCLFKLLA
ncbi:MAG: GNAT family N-acetyltransferase [Spirochaetota bacterium]|nr:GNAT family N-acetyltransferase [Spirochaetota bacterium]